MPKIVLASNNRGKIEEIHDLIKESPLQIIPQSEVGVPEIPETGQTFVENALLKARHASRVSGLAAIADDSGLVVPELNGEPGIYSARYAGQKSDDRANIGKLLTKLENVPEENRSAFFYCIIVFLQHTYDPCPIICEGIWHGKILRVPVGSHGFGYDPIFYVSTHHCSAAELKPEIKNAISHRGQAMKKLVQCLDALIPAQAGTHD